MYEQPNTHRLHTYSNRPNRSRQLFRDHLHAAQHRRSQPWRAGRPTSSLSSSAHSHPSTSCFQRASRSIQQTVGLFRRSGNLALARASGAHRTRLQIRFDSFACAPTTTNVVVASASVLQINSRTACLRRRETHKRWHRVVVYVRKHARQACRR